MNARIRRPLAALALACALAVPAAAIAKGPNSGKGHAKGPKKVPTVSYNFKGTVTDKAEDGTVTVTIARSNHHGRAWHNQTVELDLAKARIVVRDVNRDGEKDAADISVGDNAKLQVRLPRNATPGSDPIAVKHAIFRAPEPEGEPEQEPAS
jgi:hypothetical protein